jgi:hypothetical protein
MNCAPMPSLERVPLRLAALHAHSSLQRIRHAANRGELRSVLVGRRRVVMTTPAWVAQWINESGR